MNTKNTFIKIGDDFFDYMIEGNHLIVLLAICKHFCYWKLNRIRRFDAPELSKICQKSTRAIYASLAYLRQNKCLVSIGREEYINPKICYRCSEENKKDLIETILFHYPDFFNRTFDFRNSKNLTEFTEESSQSDRIIFSTPVKRSNIKWLDQYDEPDEDEDDEEKEDENWEALQTPLW